MRRVSSLLLAMALAVGILASSPRPIQAIPVPGRPQGLRFNPLTNRLYVGSGVNSVAVIDGRTGRVLRTVPMRGQAESIGVDSTANRIYVTHSANDLVSVIDGTTDTVIALVPTDDPHGVDVNSITNRVYIVNTWPRTVTVVDGDSTVITSIPVGDLPTRVAVNARTNRVYVTNTNENTVSVIDGATDTIVATIGGVGYIPIGVAVNEDTNRVYVGSYGEVAVIDGRTNQVITRIPTAPTSQQGIDVNPLLNRVYVTNWNQSTLSVIDGKSERVIARHPVGASPATVDSNPREGRVFVGSNNVFTLLDHELLKDPSFEATPNVFPKAWEAVRLGPVDRVVTESYEGGFAFRFEGQGGMAKEIRQVVKEAGRAGDALQIEAFSQAFETSENGGPYGVRAAFVYFDGMRERFGLSFSGGTHDWQRKSRSLTARKDFQGIEVSILFADQSGYAVFDALHLWRPSRN